MKNSEQSIKTLFDNCVNLKKLGQEIEKAYDDIQNNLTGPAFQEKYSKIKPKIVKFTKIFDESKQILKKIESGDIKANTSDEKIKKASNQIQEFESNLIPKINALDRQAPQLQDEENNLNLDYEEKRKRDQLLANITAAEIQNRDVIIENRGKELQEIHKTAAKIRDMTDQMAVNVHKQQEGLNDIEANVEKVKDNVIEAKKETVEAEELQRSNSKRLCCLIIIIALAIGGVTAILLSMLNIF